MNGAINNKFEYRAYLYDSWGEALLNNPSTLGNVREFDFLDESVAINNLLNYKDNLFFKKGIISESFTGVNEPSSIVWLGIDLNSMQPTIDTLEYYWKRLEVGGLVLLDDYAPPAYIDTKNAIDRWMVEHDDALLLQLPTSQAIIFKT